MIAQLCKFIIIVLILSGCTNSDKQGLVLNIHHPKIDVHLDPHQMEDAYSMMIVSQLYRGLLRFNPTGDVVGDLAASWSESADRKTYRFKLRKSTFSDGSQITAKHVQYSFARVFLLGTGMAADIDYIKGAKEFVKTKNLSDLGIKPISDDEIEFQLSFPSSLFLKHIAVADCAILAITDLEHLREVPSGFSGPYKIENSDAKGVKLVKWRRDSLESKAPPTRIYFFGSSASPIELARNGVTDSLDRDPVNNLERKELLSKNWGASPTELTGETFLILNPKFLSEDLRRYLYLRFDPAKMIKILNEPQFKPAYGLIPTGFPGELSGGDVAQMKLDKPSYKGRRASFKIDYDPSSQVEDKIAKHLKEIWSSDKINVQLNPMTKADKLKRMFSKSSGVVLGRKGIDYPDGFSVLTYFKGQYEPNYYFVNDPIIDAAIDNAVKEFDVAKRTTLYKKIQLQILNKFTIIPVLFGSQASGLWSQKVKVVPSHPMGYHTMPFETIEMRTQ